jgi:hypothetical protein
MPTAIILTGSKEWDTWFKALRRIAEANNTWQYINPDTEQVLEEPKRPIPPSDTPSSSTIDATADTQAPTIQQSNDYKEAMIEYRKDLKQYTSYKDKIGQIEAYMANTIQADIQSQMNDEDTTRDCLKFLQRNYSLTTAQHRAKARRQYNAAKVFHLRRQGFEDWAETYRLAYNRAIKMKLPEVQEFLPHKDLIYAIKSLDSGYAGNLQREVLKAEKLYTDTSEIPEDLQLSALLSEFLQCSREAPSNKPGLQAGAFATTLNDEPSPYNNIRLCICGGPHPWGKCEYIDPTLRSAGFVLDPEKAKKVEDFERKDTKGRLPKIRERNRKRKQLRRQRKTPSQSNNAADSELALDAGDQQPNNQPYSVHAVHLACSINQGLQEAFQAAYPLQHSWIMDPGADVHVCNDPTEFQWKKPASPDDYLFAGTVRVSIQAWGEVTIPVSTPKGPSKTTLKNVALIPSFFTNLVSLSRLTSSNIHFDSGKNVLYKAIGDSLSQREDVVNLTKLNGHWLLLHRPTPPIQGALQAYAAHHHRPQYSAQPLKDRLLTPHQLHLLMGHPSAEAIQKLPANVAGLQPPTSFPAPGTQDCHECLQTKGQRKVSRRLGHELGASKPFETVAVDIIQLDVTAYNGTRWLFHAIDLYTKFHIVYLLRRRDLPTLLVAFRSLDTTVQRQFNTKIAFIIADDERGYGVTEESARHYCLEQGIKIQLRAPHVEEQNGGAERSGRTLIARSRSMRITANLPLPLCSEVYMAAAYLLNRTPTRSLNWRTPFELAFNKRPSVAHLRIYGCRAYALRQQIPRGDKLSARSLVGYLVGYDSTNIYRVWIPSLKSKAHQGKVIRVRDVTFKEDRFYTQSDPTDPLLHQTELELFAETFHIPDSDSSEASSDSEMELEEEQPQGSRQTAPNQGETSLSKDPEALQQPTPAATGSPTGSQSPQQISGPTEPIPTAEQLVEPTAPTVPHSPTAEATAQRQNTPIQRRQRSDTVTNSQQRLDTNTAQRRELIDGGLRESHILPQNATRSRKPSQKRSGAYYVNAYRGAYVAAAIHGNKTRYHYTNLPTEPRNYREAMKLPYPHKQGFMQAMRKEVATVKRKGTYDLIQYSDLNQNDPTTEVLPLIWVFKYKLDSTSHLTKYKARICVRGDLQNTLEDTYAATLAARVFRALMAIAAYFNLEIRQYDAVNAFTNAYLNSPVYCFLPEGFSSPNKLWRLRKALYGLKTSPLLWYQELTRTLRALGLTEVPDAPCLWRDDRILVFFYVDDIVLLATPAHTAYLEQIERKLLQAYEIRSLGDLNTFCGIQIARDRTDGLIWLNQTPYIEKLVQRFPSPKPYKKPPAAPLPIAELVPSEDSTSEANTKLYGQIVGSIGYIANATRPDVSKAHSKLAEFLINPSHMHMQAAYHVIAYLQATKQLSLYYNASEDDSAAFDEPSNFYGSSDASFADNRSTRKSSQGYVFFLFGGPVDWKATIQRCVTKSTTEAELVAASAATTELIWWWRLFETIKFDPDNERTLYCDNLQTIRLLKASIPRLKTSLRHVDIHHHWLRKAAQSSEVNIEYIQTSLQPADGLTKLLPPQKHANWIKLLNFKDYPTEQQLN